MEETLRNLGQIRARQNPLRRGDQEMKIEIYDLGRSKKRFVIEVPMPLSKGETRTNDRIAEEIYNAVLASHALMSHEIQTSWDGEKGNVYAGFHTVGYSRRLPD